MKSGPRYRVYDDSHLPGCPSYDSPDGECECKSISKAEYESAAEDAAMEDYYGKKYGD